MTAHWKNNWKSYPTVSFDDDKEKWKGREGSKTVNNRKTAVTGPDNWKCVDEKRYCLDMYWSNDIRKQVNDIEFNPGILLFFYIFTYSRWLEIWRIYCQKIGFLFRC